MPDPVFETGAASFYLPAFQNVFFLILLLWLPSNYAGTEDESKSKIRIKITNKDTVETRSLA